MLRYLNTLVETSGSYIGVNTSTPKYMLDINSNNNTSGSIRCTNTNNTSASALYLGSGASSTNANTFINAGNSALANGGLVGIIFGKNETNTTIGNCAQIAYLHSSDGSTANALQFGIAKNCGTVGNCWTSCASGNNGIGTSTPSYPLHINAGVSGNIGNYSWINGSSFGGPNGPTDVNVSIYCSGRILCNNSFAAYSDHRIKKNIVSLDNTTALDKIRNITPVTYNYIDIIKNDNNIHYGFIAQDVEQIIKDANIKVKEFIPNIFKMATILNEESIIDESQSGSGSTLVFEDTNFIQENAKVNTSLKLIDDNNKEIIVTIKSIQDNQITVDKNINFKKIFVYGIEVDDYHVLNYKSVFTNGIAALKELNVQIQENAEIENQINTLVTSIESRLIQLKKSKSCNVM